MYSSAKIALAFFFDLILYSNLSDEEKEFYTIPSFRRNTS